MKGLKRFLSTLEKDKLLINNHIMHNIQTAPKILLSFLICPFTNEIKRQKNAATIKYNPDKNGNNVTL